MVGQNPVSAQNATISEPHRFTVPSVAGEQIGSAINPTLNMVCSRKMEADPLSLTIGQLAHAAGIAVSTVRFYERRGLLKPDSRTKSNYRTYSKRTAERLKFIRAAQTTGFSLKDIREMLALTYSEEPPCNEIAALIDRRLDDVRQRLRELRRVERALTLAHKSCCKGGPDLCDQIEQLKGKKSCECHPCS
jgi:DNA-binding transcriptional MerR regulator